MLKVTKQFVKNHVVCNCNVSVSSVNYPRAYRVNVAILLFQELTAAEEEQVEEDKEKQLQVSRPLLMFVSSLPHECTVQFDHGALT